MLASGCSFATQAWRTLSWTLSGGRGGGPDKATFHPAVHDCHRYLISTSLMRLRMEVAVRLLRSGVTSVKQVSLRCGFSRCQLLRQSIPPHLLAEPARSARWRCLDCRVALGCVGGIVIARSGTGGPVAEEQL